MIVSIQKFPSNGNILPKGGLSIDRQHNDDLNFHSLQSHLHTFLSSPVAFVGRHQSERRILPGILLKQMTALHLLLFRQNSFELFFPSQVFLLPQHFCWFILVQMNRLRFPAISHWPFCHWIFYQLKSSWKLFRYFQLIGIFFASAAWMLSNSTWKCKLFNVIAFTRWLTGAWIARCEPIRLSDSMMDPSLSRTGVLSKCNLLTILGNTRHSMWALSSLRM